MIVAHSDRVFTPERHVMRAAAAAQAVGVSAQTVHGWITRGYLDTDGRRVRVVAHIEGGVRWVILADVQHAEAVTATRGRGRTRARHQEVA